MRQLHKETYPFEGNPQRITLHWTGGSYTPSSLDAEHYHFLIDGEGVVWEGKYSVKDQDSTSSHYAAHCKGFNTQNIGVAFCAMAGSKEGGTFGKYPITEIQWNVAVDLCAWLCKGYGIQPTKEYLASHCEIERIHGKKQSGKWDVSAVPFSSLVWGDLNAQFRAEVTNLAEKMPSKQSSITVTVPRGTIVHVVEI